MNYNKIYGKFLGLGLINLPNFKIGEPLFNSHLYKKWKDLGNHYLFFF